jgi:uncharacterized membrane protein
MGERVIVTGRSRDLVILLDKLILAFSRHWLLVISALLGLYVGLPFLAPVLMHLGSVGAANIIYNLYSIQCHQLPQRSFFLFGPKVMYSLAEIQAAWVNTTNPVILRQFVGNVAMGWKVAWSDRMVSMYASLLFFSLAWGLLRRRVKALPWWGFVLLLLPMAADGGTHFISDLAGIGQGFRDSNAWLATLTRYALPATFYAGDALGSFNSWMRTISGLLFGLGVVWFSFPYLAAGFGDIRSQLEAKLQMAPAPVTSSIAPQTGRQPSR